MPPSVLLISHRGRGGRRGNRHFLLRTASFHAGCWHPERGISVCANKSMPPSVLLISHRGRRGSGGICHFLLPTSRFLLHRGVPYNICQSIRDAAYLTRRRGDAETRRAQRAQRTERMPDSCTDAACCVSISSLLRLGAEAFVTSYFRRHASYFIVACHMMDSRWLAQRTQRARRHPYPYMGRATACCGSSNLFTASDFKL
jgi:hypothetical protein